MATAATAFELVPAWKELVQTPAGAGAGPPDSWRDPHTVEPEKLAAVHRHARRACVEHPHNADFRICLGMAHAMNFDVYSSMDALEEARRFEPRQLLRATSSSRSLYYRLRALLRAEEETLKALNLAANAWELSLARKQLAEIRRLNREGTQKPAWTKPL